MNLYNRRTAITPKNFLPKKYQYFNSRDAPVGNDTNTWCLKDIAKDSICKPISWGNALTARVKLEKDFKLPKGKFTTNVEIFVLSGCLRIGEHTLRAQAYSYIPANQQLGDWEVLSNDTFEDMCGDLDHEGVELLWMENDVSCKFVTSDDKDDYTVLPSNNFIPALDSTRVGWANAQTSQFSAARKKWLRKDSNGGGVWLLAISQHYDSGVGMLQNYNEEGYCISGYCDIGDHRFKPGYFGYIPHGTLSPRHKTLDGCLFFIRVDRDLTAPGAVASQKVHHSLLPKYDWSADTPDLLPGPGPWAPKGFTAHIGCWEGTYTHIGKDGKVNDHHYCKLEIGIHGKYYSQRNTYQWKDENGKVTKEEVYEFPGEFDRSGYVRIVSPKIAGWGKVVDSVDEGDGTIVFYGVYNAPPFPDTFDLIRLFDKTGSRRFRTWQVKLKDDLLKVVHVEELRTSRENYMWLPRK